MLGVDSPRGLERRPCQNQTFALNECRSELETVIGAPLRVGDQTIKRKRAVETTGLDRLECVASSRGKPFRSLTPGVPAGSGSVPDHVPLRHAIAAAQASKTTRPTIRRDSHAQTSQTVHHDEHCSANAPTPARTAKALHSVINGSVK